MELYQEMENIVADFTISNENTINAEYSIEQEDNFDCSFEIFASGVVWGAITGNITDQTDLINILNEKATISYVDTNIQSEATSRAESDTLLQNNINTLSDNLTSEIGARTLADNNLQAQINDINNAGYITKDVNDLSYYMLTTDINTALNGKQNTISDLADIRNNAENGNTAYNTIQNYGDIVTYNADNFATASQGALADTSIQPNDNITLLNNNAGYITGIDNADVVNALGYTPYDSSNPAGYITSASLPTVNNSIITIQKNGSTVESFNLNQANNETINITVPTDTNDLTNGAGFITSADLPTLADLTTPAQLSAINSGATSTNIGQIATNTQAISTETLNRQNADNDLQSQIDAIVSSSDVFDIVGTYAELQAYDISTVPVNDIVKVLVDSTHNNSATYYRCVETDNVKSWSYIGSEGAYYTKSEADGRFVTNTSLTTILTDYVLSSDLSTTLANYVTSANLTTILDDYATKQWVNNQGYITGITSSDVTNALGFTPYNSTNPDGFITSADLPTNYVTTNTAQDVSGRKTFLGEKAIYFKQIATSNKLGFTLYNPSNTELGALEYRPSTIGSASLLALNCPQTTGGYVGFRYWGTPAVNIVAPKVATAGNYYIPTHITNGNTTVTATNAGVVNISTLLPDLTDYVTDTSLATTLADYVTNSALTTTLSDYALLTDIPTVGNGTITINQGGTQKGTFTVNQSGNTTIDLDAGGGGGTVDQTFDGTSANAQSGVAIEGELANYVKGQNSNITISNNGTNASITYANANTDEQYILQIGQTTEGINGVLTGAVDATNGQAYLTVLTTTGLLIGDLINNQGALLTVLNNNLAVNGSEVITGDNTRFDGQWVSALGSIITSSTSLNGSTALPYTITALPDDGNSYEVLLRCNALTGTSSGSMFRVECRSDLMDYSVFICGGQTRSNSYQEIAGSCIVPVSSTRKIYVSRNTSFNGNIQTLTMVAYRRIGTNS